MTERETAPEADPAEGTGEARAGRSRRRRWLLVAAFSVPALPLLAVAAFLLWFMAEEIFGDGPFGSRIPCSEAMAYAGGALPEGATGQECTADVWQDTYVEGTFRMPGGDVRAWVERSFPDREPTDPGAVCPADVCVRVDRIAEPPPSGRAHAVGVTVTYEDGGTALVHLEAHGT